MKKFCAHRGLSKLMPENTLPAFAAALSLGADDYIVKPFEIQELILRVRAVLRRTKKSAWIWSTWSTVRVLPYW